LTGGRPDGLPGRSFSFRQGIWPRVVHSHRTSDSYGLSYRGRPAYPGQDCKARRI